jgi:hypothetical protein
LVLSPKAPICRSKKFKLLPVDFSVIRMIKTSGSARTQRGVYSLHLHTTGT